MYKNFKIIVDFDCKVWYYYYVKQAQDFLKRTNTKLEIEYYDTNKYFPDDKEMRDIYKCILKNKRGQYTFKFGNSIYNTKKNIEPTEYDILACMQKYDVGTFEDFASEFGYSIYDTKERQIAKSYTEQFVESITLYVDSLHQRN